MAAITNSSGLFTADIQNYIAQKTLPLVRRELVLYRFGDPERLPKGFGTTFTATRFNRVPLPQFPLAEGSPPDGQTMSIAQQTVVLQQWGDCIRITDVAELTIKHPIMNEAKKLIALQIGELLERNTNNAMLGFTQVNYVNNRGSRANLQNGDVMNTSEISRAYFQLYTIGAPRYSGDEMTNIQLEADAGGARASSNPRSMPHYVGVCHPFILNDLTKDSSFVLATSYSDINRLYNAEFGEWAGTRFCASNMIPSWTGIAAITGTPGTSGNLATGTYFIQVTASDVQNQYESQIYQVSGAISVVGPTGSISVSLPSLPGFTFNVYIGTTGAPANLALSASGPTTGVRAGQAVSMAGGQTVTLTGTSIAQAPPAAPATGVTVYPTYIFGRGSYGQVMLDDVKISWLDKADKFDYLNQLRIVGWKVFYGTLIKNNRFAMRIESTTTASTTFG